VSDYCTFTTEEAALDGTICGSGQMCVEGSCVASALVPAQTSSLCPAGTDQDTFIYPQMVDFTSKLPNRISCAQAFDIVRANNGSVEVYCSQPNFNAYCCQSCKSKILNSKIIL
jgi:hypothetical protein